jgi:hypothetical protein
MVEFTKNVFQVIYKILKVFIYEYYRDKEKNKSKD